MGVFVGGYSSKKYLCASVKSVGGSWLVFSQGVHLSQVHQPSKRCTSILLVQFLLCCCTFLRGGHLSQVHQPSKWCTSILLLHFLLPCCTSCSVGTLETSAPPWRQPKSAFNPLLIHSSFIWLGDRLGDTPLRGESASPYSVHNVHVAPLLGDMVDIFTYRSFVIEYTQSAFKYNNKV